MPANNISVISPDRQGAAEVCQDIAPALETIWRILEGAGAAALEYLENEGFKRDPYLLSAIVRAQACKRFDAEGPSAVGAPDSLIREPLPNMGLSFVYGGAYQLKIRKAAHGSLPPPGSQRAENYCEQLSLFRDEIYGMHLFVIWDLAPDGALSLKLVCPREGSASRSTVSVHWMVELSHPAETMLPAPITEVADDDVLDIPIELVDDQEL